MSPTTRAVWLSGFIVFAAVAGLGRFLGFEAGTALVAGTFAGVLAGAVIWAAARRAASFHSEEITPVEPGFPGPPDHADETNDADEINRGDEPDHDTGAAGSTDEADDRHRGP